MCSRVSHQTNVRLIKGRMTKIADDFFRKTNEALVCILQGNSQVIGELFPFSAHLFSSDPYVHAIGSSRQPGRVAHQPSVTVVQHRTL